METQSCSMRPPGHCIRKNSDKLFNKTVMFMLEFSPNIPFASKFSVLKRPEKIGLKRHEIFLAFDDGPNPSFDVTFRLLDILRAEAVPGTFCFIGAYVRHHPDLVRQVAHAGHTIACHGLHHVFPWWGDLSKVLWEVEQFTQAVNAIPDIPPYVCQYYRPPYGIISPAIASELAQRGMQPVPLTFYVHDAWIRPENANTAINTITSRIKQASCAAIVIHERLAGKRLTADTVFADNSPFNKQWVPQAVQWLIRELKQEDYRFISMPELARRHAS